MGLVSHPVTTVCGGVRPNVEMNPSPASSRRSASAARLRAFGKMLETWSSSHVVVVVIQSGSVCMHKESSYVRASLYRSWKPNTQWAEHGHYVVPLMEARSTGEPTRWYAGHRTCSPFGAAVTGEHRRACPASQRHEHLQVHARKFMLCAHECRSKCGARRRVRRRSLPTSRVRTRPHRRALRCVRATVAPSTPARVSLGSANVTAE